MKFEFRHVENGYVMNITPKAKARVQTVIATATAIRAVEVIEQVLATRKGFYGNISKSQKVQVYLSVWVSPSGNFSLQLHKEAFVPESSRAMGYCGQTLDTLCHSAVATEEELRAAVDLMRRTLTSANPIVLRQ